MKTVSDRVIVQVQQLEEKVVGGVILVASAQEKPVQGEVILVGPECKTVSEGDQVLYSKYGGQPILIEGTEFIGIRETDVMVVL